METIKIVPSWAELMPLLWETAANGNQDAQKELVRLARIIDDLNAERQAEVPESKFNACDYLAAYIGDLEYVSSEGVSLWNMMGNGTPSVDPDAEDADQQMADYIGEVKTALAELREVAS